jgi:hypothetical protein
VSGSRGDAVGAGARGGSMHMGVDRMWICRTMGICDVPGVRQRGSAAVVKSATRTDLGRVRRCMGILVSVSCDQGQRGCQRQAAWDSACDRDHAAPVAGRWCRHVRRRRVRMPKSAPLIPCMSLRRCARSSMRDTAWSALSRGRPTSQPAMAVALVMRVSHMAHLCGNLHRAGLTEHLYSSTEDDL